MTKQHYEAAEEECTPRRYVKVFLDKFRKEASETRDIDAGSGGRTELHQHDEDSGQKTKAPLRRSTRARDEREWFSIDVMPGISTVDEPSLKEELEEEDSEA